MAYFKTVVVLFVVFVVSSAKPTEEQKAMHKECTEFSKVDEALFEKAKNGEFVEDANFKKYFLCAAKKIGYLDEAGELNLEKLRKCFSAKITDEALLDELVKKCGEKKETVEDTAFYAASCFFKNSPEDIKFDVNFE